VTRGRTSAWRTVADGRAPIGVMRERVSYVGVAIAVFSALVDVKADPDEVRGSIPATVAAMSEFLRRNRLELPPP
jgi:hypothetical protein